MSLKEPKGVKGYTKLVIGGILAVLVAVGVFRILRAILFVALSIYAFILVVSMGSPEIGLFGFLQENVWSISRLFVVLVTLYLVFVKKKSSAVGKRRLTGIQSY